MNKQQLQFITIAQTYLLHYALLNRNEEKGKFGYIEGWLGDLLRVVDRIPANLTTQEVIDAALVWIFWISGEDTQIPTYSWFFE